MKTIKKENLPQKICVACKRPFSWRKKWARTWQGVKYCSAGCRKNSATILGHTETFDATGQWAEKLPSHPDN